MDIKEVYNEVKLAEKLKVLDGERFVYCSSNQTVWKVIEGCEVSFHCARCNEEFFIEKIFLSEQKQKAISEVI
jgi:hypothetical protein